MKNQKRLHLIAALILLALTTASVQELVRERSGVSGLAMNTCAREKFREQELSREMYLKLKESETEDVSWTDLLTVSMLEGDFAPKKISAESGIYMKYKKAEFLFLKDCYSAVWSDIGYFPVASEEISFENTWMEPVDYEGTEEHDGTDLFGRSDESGYYPVISMTNGRVELAGWQNSRGYCAGIRTPEGGFFFYAHLDSFENGLEEGAEVEAGDIIGYMGSTGFGPAGTKGRIPVHLHLGVYISGPDGENISVNPYWILKIFAKKTRKYTY